MAYISIGTIWMDRIALLLAMLNALVLFIILSFQLLCPRVIVQFQVRWDRVSSMRSVTNASSSVGSASSVAASSSSAKSLSHDRRSKNSSHSHNKLSTNFLHGFALCTLLSTVLYGTQRSISAQAIGDCTLHVILGAVFWLSVKLNMYLFFITRLYVAFHHSIWKFSSKLFIFLYVLVIFAYITEILDFIFFGEGVLVVDEEFDLIFCGNISPVWTFMYLALWDFFLSILLCVLFTKRLFAAFMKCQQQKKVIKREKLMRMISKIARYITLTIVGVNTTFWALFLFAMTSWFTMIALDLVINGWCIFLMYGENKLIFNCICGCAHQIIGNCCFKCVECTHVCTGIHIESASNEFLALYELNVAQDDEEDDDDEEDTINDSGFSPTSTTTDTTATTDTTDTTVMPENRTQILSVITASSIGGSSVTGTASPQYVPASSVTMTDLEADHEIMQAEEDTVYAQEN